jgi:transposase
VFEPNCAPVCVVADTIVGTVELGVTITNAALDRDTTVVFCNLITTGPGRCPGCDTVGTYRDTVERRVTDVPVAGHPMLPRVKVPRYRCANTTCQREVFCHDSDRLARAGRTTTRRCATYVLGRLIADRATVAAVAPRAGPRLGHRQRDHRQRDRRRGHQDVAGHRYHSPGRGGRDRR